jgi:hypothetical protein
MDQTESAQTSARPCDTLDLLLQSNRITLCEPQRRRLTWLTARYGEPVVWDRQRLPPNRNGVVIVVEPPTGPSAESFYRALHPGCIVVVPFGENPAFDFLKSKLRDFGTIGPSGADGPHEFWWGGLDWSTVVNGLGRARPPLIVSCYPRLADRAHIRRLTRSIESLGLDFIIEAIDTAAPEQMHGSEKASFMQNVWMRQDRPILWVEPDAVLAGRPSLVADIDCDFAAHKWNRWEMSTRTLYFGRSNAAEALLHTWHCFVSSHPTIWDGYLLDQAWSTVSSQMPLETVWLPRSYHAASGDQAGCRAPVIVHDFETTTSDLGPDLSIPKPLRAARRAGRIGAPESLVVMKSAESSDQAVTVILRDVQFATARGLAANVEAITRAFAQDSGGYGHLELSLCPWQDDVKAAVAAANFGKNRILEIAPSDDVSEGMFRRFSESADHPSHRNVLRLSGRDSKSVADRPPLRPGPPSTTN